MVITTTKKKKKPILSKGAFATGQFGNDSTQYDIRTPQKNGALVSDVNMGEKSSKGIRFNADGTVDVQFKGNDPTRLTREEYGALNGKRGMITENVASLKEQQLISDEDRALQAEQISAQRRQAAIDRSPAGQSEQQQTQELATKQAQELAAVGEQDYTQLGMEQPQQEASAITGQQPTFQNRVANSLFGNQMALDAEAAGGQLQTGALPIVGAPAVLPQVNLLKSVASLKEKVTSLRNIAILGSLGTGASTVYGLLTKGKVRVIEGDINDIVSRSNELARQVTNGADPLVVRDQLIEAENSILDKVADLNVAKRRSVADRVTGSDSQEYARKQLTKIVLRRQAVERYMANGDINAFNAVMGVYSLE